MRSVSGSAAEISTADFAGLNCDVETDLCGWTNVLLGDTASVNWWRQEGPYSAQSALVTGPVNDHTLDNNYGHYMLFWTGADVIPGTSAVVKCFCVPGNQKGQS